MASYTLTVSTTSANTAALNSTKVKVVSNAAAFYAIDANASITSNIGPLIPANNPVFINMGGIGRKLGINACVGTATVTVTECGTVYQSSLNQNSTTFLNT